MRKFKPFLVQDHRDVQRFFDNVAPQYGFSHGAATRSLRYRLKTILEMINTRGGTLLEMGCGTGDHILELLHHYDKGIGVDISPRMLARARQRTRNASHSSSHRLEWIQGDCEELDAVPENSITTILAVGSLEHFLDQGSALVSASKVLKPGGEFICLSPHGNFAWYRHMAPILAVNTKHLSTDCFPTLEKVQIWCQGTNLEVNQLKWWSFVPLGDIPFSMKPFVILLDRVGRILPFASLKSGLAFCLKKKPVP